MKKLLKNKKGIILIATTLAIVFVLGLSAVFFSRSVSEKRVVDVEKFNMQADFLSEAGANHGLSELRERIRANLSSNISKVRNGATIKSYYTNKDSLGFLKDYAYVSGEDKFTVDNSAATLSLAPLSLITNINGTYNSNIIITSAKDPESPKDDVYIFYYNYSNVGNGVCSDISPNITKQITLSGNFSVTVQRDNFAKYALFTNHHTSKSGGTVWFTERTNFYGPVHTNDRLSFANNPSAHFTDEVTQHLTTARYYNGGRSILSSDDHNGVLDVPIFDQGFELGVSEVNLESALNPNDLKTQALGTMSEPGGSGIYLPNESGALTGGIYIRGDADRFTMGKDGSNNPQYTIVQGLTTEIITVNYTANTTTVQIVGGSTNTYSGIPDGVDNEGILIYGKDSINGFAGMVQKDSTVTVSAERDIVISNHIRYENYNANPLNADNYANMLGILSWGGDVRINTSAPNDVEIHGVVMSPHGVFTVDSYNSGSPRGTATLLGGVISDFYGAFGTFRGAQQVSGYGRNFVYDARVLAGQTPPYFPYMANFTSLDDGALDNRPLWKKD